MNKKTALLHVLLLLWVSLAPVAMAESAKERMLQVVPVPTGSPLVLSGRVIVRADDHRAVIALDEEDSAGELDGRVDHLFSVFALDLVLQRIALEDSFARVEYQPGALRVVLPTEKREIEFRVFTFEVGSWRKEKVHSSQVFETGLQLFHYSGEVVHELFLEDIQKRGTSLLSYTDMADLRFPLEDRDGEGNHWATGKVLEPFDPDPDPTSGSGGCVQTCSKSCAKGRCSASCRTGHCAKCSCLDDPPGTPFCTCA